MFSFQIFGTKLDPDIPQVHSLIKPIKAQYVKVEVLSWVGQACMRLQLTGCKEQAGQLGTLEGSPNKMSFIIKTMFNIDSILLTTDFFLLLQST